MKKIILMLLISITSASCDTQFATAVKTAFKNVITGDGFSDSVSDQLYEDYKKSENLPKMEAPLIPICIDKTKSMSTLSKQLPTLDTIKDLLCSCKTWGTCDSKSCACGILCPDNFSILNRTELAMNQSAENSLGFTNGNIEIAQTDPTYSGYCWGHAVVTQRFNRLAKFEPSKPAPFPDNDIEQANFYKELVKKINNNEPVDIPGFANLREFSLHPLSRGMIEDAVKESWAHNAMSTQGLSMVTSSTPQGKDYYESLFDDIEYRLKHFQSPTIVFNERGNAMFSHAVLVSGVEKDSKGNRYLCLRDNNYYPSQLKNCSQKMRLQKDGTCYYDGWQSSIGKVVLAHTENSNTIEQMKNLRKKCIDEKNCQ